MYDRWTVRFTSRDPLPAPGEPVVLSDNNWFGDRLTMMRNRYGYATNNPLRYKDPSGLTPTEEYRRIRTIFLAWYNANKQVGPGWLKSLPNCPCEIRILTSSRTLFGIPSCIMTFGTTTQWLNPNPSVWSDPSSKGVSLHPDAAMCIRSKSASSGGSGQQCCYDDHGKLITHGQGAGTPDYTAPIGTGGFAQHQLRDVYAYNYAVYLDQATTPGGGFIDMYLEVRPPNPGADAGGQPCPKNP